MIYQLVLELGTADDPAGSFSSSSSASSSDAEEDARNEALGLGGAKLKAVLSEINKNDLGAAGGSGIAVKGGEVLTIIYERMQNMSGDPTAKTLYETLLKAAGVPYVSMLKMWTTTGRLVDPYEELCVKESKFINRGMLEMDYTDEYWERRYTVSTYLFSMQNFIVYSIYDISSYVTVRRCLVPKDIRRVYLSPEVQVADYLAVHASRHCLKDGSTKSCWLVNI